ncbi:MAG: type II toxin-antitoxin system RelE/ParE family toxin [Gammaproteobacteria bacterium]
MELPEYLREAEKVLGDEEMLWIINTLARKPKSGVLITGTGGIRKLRSVRPGTGKSSGVRVIYYYHNQSTPLFLLTLFAKGDKPNLTKSERNELAELAQILRSHYAGKRR